MSDPTLEEIAPVEAKRIRSFSHFFKSYMSVSTIVVAALPIPITAWSVIPAFESQRGSLTTYTPLVCFLILSYVFYKRHSIGSILFVHRHHSGAKSSIMELLPLLLIILFIILIFAYHHVLNLAIQDLKLAFADEATERWRIGSDEEFNALPDGTVTFSGTWLLANVTFDKVSYGPALMLLYLGIFAVAECAFVLMALREYLQDLIGLTDVKAMQTLMAKPTP